MWSLPLLAFAFGAMPTEAELFAAVLGRIDLDGDGSLSREEYARVDAANTFDTIDADRDAAVTATELGVWVTVTQPRAEDRAPSRLVAEPVPGVANGPPPVAPPAPQAKAWARVAPAPAPSRVWTRVAVLGSMSAAAVLVAWFMFRGSGSARTGRRRSR